MPDRVTDPEPSLVSGNVPCQFVAAVAMFRLPIALSEQCAWNMCILKSAQSGSYFPFDFCRNVDKGRRRRDCNSSGSRPCRRRPILFRPLSRQGRVSLPQFNVHSLCNGCFVSFPGLDHNNPFRRDSVKHVSADLVSRRMKNI